MHYYTRNLGDYAKKAGRLSMLQHGAYTLLLDACYDRERFPTESEAIEWTWASTPEEEQAVKFVLVRFFDKQQDGTYVQSRVKEELALFKIGGIQNRLIAISREARKQKRDDLAKACDQLRDEIKNAPLSKTHEAWTGVIDALIKTHEAPPNQEPITNNQEPLFNNTLAGSDEQAGNDPVNQIPKSKNCPVQQIIELYREFAPRLIQPKIVPESVKAQISARWRESEKHQNLDYWKRFFEYCNDTPLLTGNVMKRDGSKPFRAGIEWIFTASNYAKIVNGNYDEVAV